MLRGLDERAVGRRLARMDEPAEAVVLVAVLLRDLAVAVRGVLPRKVVVAAVVVVVCCTVIIRGGALPVKRVIGVADTVAVAVGPRGQAAVVDAPIVAIGREGDGGGVPRLLLARGADLHARHVAEGVIVQQVVLPEARRAQIPFAAEVAQLRAVVGIADGGDTVDVREGGAVAAGAVAVVLPRTVGRRRRKQVRGAGIVAILRRDTVSILGCRAEAARAVNREIKCGRCRCTARLMNFLFTGWNFALFCHSIRNLNTASTMIKIFCSIVTQTSVFHRKDAALMLVKPFSCILHLPVPIIYNLIRQVAERLSGHIENLICLRREKIAFVYLNSSIYVIPANVYCTCIVSIIYLHTQRHSCIVQDILL